MSDLGPIQVSAPTTWNYNPLADTSLVIDYGDSSVDYGSDVQPYGNFAEPTSLVSWKTPTAYESSLTAGATQQYYGPFPSVPLSPAPSVWYANGAPANLAGKYNPSDDAYANLWPYDGTVIPSYSDANYTFSDSSANYSNANENLVYDSDDREYDGGNGQSFENWKTPTAWQVIAGNRSL